MSRTKIIGGLVVSTTVNIKVRLYAGTYIARTERLNASCTMSEECAVKRVAMKYATREKMRGVLSLRRISETEFSATWTHDRKIASPKSNISQEAAA